MGNIISNSKVTAVLLTSIVIVFIIATYSIININIANKNIVSIYNDRVLPLQELKNVSDAYIVDFAGYSQKTVNGTLSWDSTLKVLELTKTKINYNWSEYLKTYLTPEEEAKVKLAKYFKVNADSLFNRVINVLKKGRNTKNEKLLKLIVASEFYPNIEPFTKKIDDLISIQTKEANNLKTLSVIVFHRIVFVFVLILLLCILTLWLLRQKRDLDNKLAIKNNELIMANQELQTTIEELDTSTEELLTNNEELTVLNEALEQHKNHLEKLVTQRFQELQESESKLKTLVSTIPDLVWLKDIKGVYLYCNRRISELFGVKEEKIIGKTDYDFFSKDLADNFKAYDKKSIDLGNPSLNEEEVTFADGHKEILETIKTPIFKTNGEIMGVLGIGRDITERKRIEQELAESQGTLNAVFEGTKDIILLVDSLNFKIITYNTAAKVFFQTYRNTVIHEGSTIEDLFSPNRVASWYEYYKKALQDGPFEVEYKTEFGQLDMWLSFNPLKRNDITFSISVFAKDLTQIRKAEEELDILKHSIDIAPDAAYWLNNEGKFIYVNDTACKTLGYTRDELLQLTIYAIAPNLTPERWNQIWAQLRDIKSYTSQSVNRRKNGETFPVEISDTYLIYNGKEYCNGFAKDITERLKAEQLIKISESKYRRLHTSMTDGFVFVSMQGEIKEYNKAFQNMLDYTDTELVKLTYQDITPEKWHAFEQEIINHQIMTNGFSEVYEKEYKRKDGTIFPVELRTYLWKNDSGENEGLWAIVRDISERKLAGEALRLSEEKFFKAFYATPVPLSISRMSDGLYIECNDAYAKLSGYKRDEIISKTSTELNFWITPDDRTKFMSELIKTNSMRDYEINFMIKDGTIINTLASNELIIINGESCILSVLYDITERKNYEKQILTAVIETEEKERTNFSQELHDGLGPLISAIKMYVQLISIPDSKMDGKTIIDKTEELINEASKTVRDISFKLSPHVLQNYGIIEALLAYIQKVKETNNIEFVLNHIDVCRFIEVSEIIVYRVICECITNTLKHANASVIELDLVCNNNELEIKYHDNGRGFDVAQTINSHKGIGLLNMQSRIKSINGSMNIESNPSSGTTIIFKIKTDII